jgi:hypothetical protein
LAGVQSHVLNDAVALVEDAEHRDALRHRRDTALPCRGDRNVGGGGKRSILLLRTLAARGQRETGEQDCTDRAHVYSGIQGS